MTIDLLEETAGFEETVEYEHDVLGLVVSRIPAGYQGPTQLHAQGRVSSLAVFPDFAQALSAARFAVGELGGYNRAVLTPSTAEAVTFEYWDDWAFAI